MGIETPKRKLNRILNDNKSLFSTRFIPNRKNVKLLVEYCRDGGHKIILTQGSFDMVHIGHAKYLEAAKNQGDILIVGVDDNKKVRKRKGQHRPVVPEDERLAMLTHLRSVDIVTLKKSTDPKWYLIKLIRPDVLVVTARMKYTKDDIKKLSKFCGSVVTLKTQATTSTSARVRLLHTGGADNIAKRIIKRFPNLVDEIFDEVKNHK